MRRTVVEMGALAALLLGGALTWGQEAAPPAAVTTPASTDKPKEAPAKSKLEEMLQQALQNNPDLRLAAAKVAEAEAELNRARLKVVQRVGAAYQAVEAQKEAVEDAAAELNDLKKLVATGAASSTEMRAASQKLIDAKGKLAALETEMPYLLGKQPANIIASPAGAMGGMGLSGFTGYLGGGGLPGMGQLGGGFGALGGGRLSDPTADAGDPTAKPVPVLGKTAERIRAALDKPYSSDLKKAKLSQVVADVSAAFQKANPGLIIKCNFTPDELDSREVDNVQFDKVPFGAVLVWIEDSVSLSRVVVRDYGLVIASAEGVPQGAPSLHGFWKLGQEDEKWPTKEQSSNAPAKNVEGVVESINANGLVRITIGSDAGVAKGDTFEVYRLDAKALEQSKYLGRIKIIETAEKSAVGKPVRKMAGPVQVGDNVSSRILGD